MKPLAFGALLCASLFGADRGLPARSDPASYPASAGDKGVRIGAEVMDPDMVNGSFSTDLEGYAVIEVAIYPPKDGKPVEVSPMDFALKFDGRMVRPASTRSIAGINQRRGQARSKDIVLFPTVGVSTGSWGTGTQVGVGVGVGGNPPGPASTDRDRDVMEMELDEKQLPEISASKPVAGYLYFPVGKTKTKTPSFELVYDAQEASIRLPLKTK